MPPRAIPTGQDCCRALEFLCEAYWYPLYVYARRSGDSPELTQDHTQDFFTGFLEHNYFDRADAERGALPLLSAVVS